MARHHRRAPGFLPGARAALAGTGILAIAAGIGVAAQIGAFYQHSSTAGRALVGQERREIAEAAGRSTACRAPLNAAGGGVRGSAGPGAEAAGPGAQGP